MQFNEDAIQKLMQSAKDQGVFDKAVAGFVLPDGTQRVVEFNTPRDTVFDIASLTKVCPTSTLALRYILEGKLAVNTRVVDYIPELHTNYRDDICIFHLLTHSLDYRVPMKTLRTLPAKEILNALFTYQFEKAPGADFNYGNPASVLLGIILNRLTGKSLQDLGREQFFEPLGMTRSGWDPLTRDFNRIAKTQIMPTEICAFRGREIQGEIHDESAWVLRELFPVGSAGMFSCIPDLLNFVQMVLNDGTLNNVRVMPEGVLDLVSHNAFERPDCRQFIPKGTTETADACTALGWELNASKFMGTRVSPRAFGKTGFTGASIVADPIAGAAVVLLSNFTYPHREPNAVRIHAFRSRISDAFFGMLL